MRMIPPALHRVRAVFGLYPRPEAVPFCGFCYTPSEIEYFRKTPLFDFDADHARSLLVETADHWESTPVYKHYLPVILGKLIPPGHGDALYPAHLFETLGWHRYSTWPSAERDAVADFIEALLSALRHGGDADAEEWASAWADLNHPPS